MSREKQLTLLKLVILNKNCYVRFKLVTLDKRIPLHLIKMYLDRIEHLFAPDFVDVLLKSGDLIILEVKGLYITLFY